MEKFSRSPQLLVVCAHCQRVMQENDEWEIIVVTQIDMSEVSKEICYSCLEKYYPLEYLKLDEAKKTKMRNEFKDNFENLYGHLTR